MRNVAWLISIVLAGCVVSVQPVVSAAVSTFDARLLGTWGEVDGKDRIVITRGDSNAYALEYTDADGKVGTFDARLGTVGKRTVLDVQPAPRESAPMPEAGSLIRGHVMYVLSIATDSVLVSLLNPKVLREAIKAKTVALRSFDDNDQVVLTGTTDEITRALARYIERPRALDEPSTWRRLKDQSQEAEVLEELGVMRAAAAVGNWEALKRFFPVGTKWAEQAERWVKDSESKTVGFFERSARNKVGSIQLRSAARDTMDILVPYTVVGDSNATYAARLVRAKSGWVLVCSMESHGRPLTLAGCRSGSTTLHP